MLYYSCVNDWVVNISHMMFLTVESKKCYKNVWVLTKVS